MTENKNSTIFKFKECAVRNCCSDSVVMCSKQYTKYINKQHNSTPAAQSV